MIRLNALLRLLPDREYRRCSSALLCVYSMAATTTQEQFTKVQHRTNPWGGFHDSSLTALTMKTNTTETATNVQTDSTCTRVRTHSHAHVYRIAAHVYTHTLRLNLCSYDIKLIFNT